jgi:hypothetical protein
MLFGILLVKEVETRFGVNPLNFPDDYIESISSSNGAKGSMGKPIWFCGQYCKWGF